MLAIKYSSKQLLLKSLWAIKNLPNIFIWEIFILLHFIQHLFVKLSTKVLEQCYEEPYIGIILLSLNKQLLFKIISIYDKIVKALFIYRCFTLYQYYILGLLVNPRFLLFMQKWSKHKNKSAHVIYKKWSK